MQTVNHGYYATTDGYDLSSNETSTTINGGTYHETWDDEDRLTSVTTPGGITDTFVYNGLGLRVGKTDSTGSYSYVCETKGAAGQARPISSAFIAIDLTAPMAETLAS